jgi:hypothetical protein
VDFFLAIFFGIPLLSIVFTILVADAKKDIESKLWKKGIAIGFVTVLLILLFSDDQGRSSEEKLLLFVGLTSFLIALWYNRDK